MIVSSIGTACVVFLIVGLLGYVTYGSNVAPDLLKSYPGEKVRVVCILDEFLAYQNISIIIA